MGRNTRKPKPPLILRLLLIFIVLCTLLFLYLHLVIQSQETSPSPPRKTSVAAAAVDDVALLELASRADPNPKPGQKIAFMFLTTSPLPFAPLWEKYFARAPKSWYNVYVHADPGANNTPPFSGVFASRVIPSKPTRRHTPSLIAAARRLLAYALLDDGSNSMFALLSPSCIPLHSLRFTRRVLLESGRSFVEILADEPGLYERWAVRGEDAMLPEVDFADFRFGSQFWVLNRKHARIVVSDRRMWPKFRQRCLWEYGCHPEEHYFPTLLSMVDPWGSVPCTLTHVDWSYSDWGHPRTYYSDEVDPELILGLRMMRPRYGDEKPEGPDPSEGIPAVVEGGPGFGDGESDGSDFSDRLEFQRPHPFLFARKFEPESLGPLMDIADDVIFND